MSDSLRPHGLQHSRLPCPSLSPRVCSQLCPLSRWCYPTISLSIAPPLFLPSIFPSIRIFSNELTLHIRWPKYWSFSFSISPSSDYSGLISFRIGWFSLLAVQGTLRNLLQHHSSIFGTYVTLAVTVSLIFNFVYLDCPFFDRCVWLKIYQFYLSFKNSAFSLIDLSCCYFFVSIYLLIFIISFFLLTLHLVLFFFCNSFRWKVFGDFSCFLRKACIMIKTFLLEMFCI